MFLPLFCLTESGSSRRCCRHRQSLDLLVVTFLCDLSVFTEAPERGEGRRRPLDAMDEDDPNFLLAVQLSLQESRRDREPGVDGGQQRAAERRAALERGLEAWRPDAPSGARGGGPSPSHLASDAPRLNPLPLLPPPPPSLSAMLLELEDSLMKLGNMAAASPAYHPESRPQAEQLLLCGGRAIAAVPPSHVRGRSSAPEPSHQSCCPVAGCLSGAEGPDEHVAPPRTDISSDLAGSAPSPEPHAARRSSRLEPPPPLPPHLCLPSPEAEPELPLSPVIPPGGPYTPSEALDPAASAQLLDNIMAWFNSNIGPQSLALVPSPPTTDTDSSPDTTTHTESESASESRDAFVGPPPGGGGSGVSELESDRGAVSSWRGGRAASSRPSSLDLGVSEVSTEVGTEVTVCAATLSQDAADAQLPPLGNSLPVIPPADSELQLEVDQSPEEEWEEQVHLV